MPKLISVQAKQLLFNPKVDPKVFRRVFDKKLTAAGNEKVTHVLFEEPFTDVLLNIPEGDPKYAAFGRLAVDMNHVHILVNHQARTVTIDAELGPAALDSQEKYPDLSNFLEKYDFNVDKIGQRSLQAEIAVRLAHHSAPRGSTSYRIFTRHGKLSKFRRVYSFIEFFGRF